MELLDLLEQRISTLLVKLEKLSTENESLRQGQARELEALVNENKALLDELEKERDRNSTALARIEALIERLKEQAEQE